MADLDDFFAKKDKKKKTKKGFSKANTDVLAKNLEENDRREQKAEEKASPLATSEATKLAFEQDVMAKAEAAAKAAAAVASDAGADQDTKKAAAAAAAAEATAGAAASVPGGGNVFSVSSNNDLLDADHGSLMLMVVQAAANESGQLNDDEWKNYDDEKKDYSGLKIASLKVDDDEPEEDEHEINEEGEKVPVKRGDGGPWNKTAAGGGNASPETSRRESPEPSAPTPAAPAAPAASDSKSSYVPPHLRGSSGGGGGSDRPAPRAWGGAGGGGGGFGGGRRNRAAPDINSEVYFPSLGGAVHDDRRRQGENDFEEVQRSGGQQYSRPSNVGERPRLVLDNKFDALRD